MTAAAIDPLPARTLRLGFAGTGWIGRHRLQAAAGTALCEVAALCDSDPQALAQAQALAPGAAAVPDFDQLLALPLDGVVIATPSALHAEQALAALRRGLPVFCQKPLARCAAEAGAVVAAAAAADLQLGVDLCYRQLAGIGAVQNAIAAGELGTVFAVEGVFHNAYGPDRPWFYERELAGGGCFLDLGIHLVDLVLWLLQRPRVSGVRSHLFRRGRRLPPRPDAVEDHAEVTLELGGGSAVARLATSWGAAAGRDAVIELSLYGTGGGARLRNVDGSFYDFVVERTVGTRRQQLAGPPDAWGGRAIAAWTTAVAAGAGFDSTALDHLAVARVIDEVYGR